MSQRSLAPSTEEISVPYSLLEKLLVMGKLWEEFLEDLRKFSKTKKLLRTIETQSWYWTKRWQKGEKEADEDIRTGRVRELKSIEDLDKPLEELFGGEGEIVLRNVDTHYKALRKP